MEVIPFSGYTLPEKLAIAEGYLVPKQLKAHGLRRKDAIFTREGLSFVVDGYTREAGVRSLEREVAALCRKTAHKVVRDRRRNPETLTPERVEALLGVPRYKERKVLQSDEVGIAVGLAWTQAGGDILLLEASLMPGKGGLTLTGQLGEVMQESARAAFSYIRGQSSRLDLPANHFSESDVHVHVPEGAIPKDGPSAGVALAAAMLSAFVGIPVRHDVAMTGEVTLRGKVLAIGGLKEKILAAKQHDVFEVVLPRDNEKDLAEVPDGLRQGMRFHFAETLEEVFQWALTEDPFRRRRSMVLETTDRPRPEKAP
jgi:ATP-dependent Lon protease